MRRGAAALALLLCVLTPWGRAQTAQVLRGHVVAADTGDPIRSARIVVRTSHDLPPLLTDSDGDFSVEEASAGCCTLSVAKPGYANTTLKATPATEPVVIKLPRSAVISGVVMDERGDPVIGVSVIVETLLADGRSSRVVAAPTTDDLGEYRAASLSAGQVTVSMFASPSAIRMLPNGGLLTSGRGDPQQRVYFPGVSNVAEAATFSLQPGDDKAGVNFTVSGAAIRYGQGNVPRGDREVPAATAVVIGGRILGPNGSPPISAVVRLIPAASTNAPPKLALTDAAGMYQFVLPREAAGTYRVAANAPGYLVAAYGQRQFSDLGEEITVAAGDRRDRINVTLVRPGAIAGRLFDEHGEAVESVPLRVSQIRWVDGRRQLIELLAFSRPTDDRGRYRLFGLPPGEYLVSAAVGQVQMDLPLAELPGYGTTYFPGTPNPVEAQRVTVGRAQEVVGVDFAIARVATARVSGRAIDSAGEAITGGIALMPSRRSGAVVTAQRGAKIDPDGHFEFPNVAPGEYVLQASRHRSSGWNEGESASLFVTVTGVDVTDLAVRTSRGSTLSGRVVLEGRGTFKPGQIELMAVPVDVDVSPQIGGGPARATPDEDLKFEMAGLSGPRRLRVTRVPSGWMLQRILLNGVEVTDTPLPFGRADQSISDVEVVLSQHVSSLTGRATAGGKGAVASILVFPADPDARYPQSRFFKNVVSGADGTFTVEGLPPGQYLAAAVEVLPFGPVSDDWQDPDYLDTLTRRARSVTISEGATTPLTLDVSPR